jgi:HAD superfamily hydrolase (TIGR01509 family)
MSWRCIIFDCDGVLVNSECVYASVFAQMASNLGAPLTFLASLELVRGRPLPNCIQDLENIIGRPVPNDFERRFRSRCSRQFRSRLSAIEGVEVALSQLSVPYCVASNSPLNKIILMLKTVELFHYFRDRIYSGYELRKWKPDPALFLNAATQMGFQPFECAVVEDSEIGVSAARVAGMGVFALAEQPYAKRLQANGALTLPKLSNLPELLSTVSPATFPIKQIRQYSETGY